MVTHTPWGPAQSQSLVAPGITRVDTASHGGYHLSADRVRQVPVCITPFAGSRQWYEEDSDWAVVALMWLDEFSAGLPGSGSEVDKIARATLGAFHPDWIVAIDAAVAARANGGAVA